MNEPDALAGADEIVAVRDRVELASLDAFVRAHYPRLVRLAGLITRDAAPGPGRRAGRARARLAQARRRP